MIKVGYLVSYDYQMLLTSIKQLYGDVDKIYLAIDCNRKTWSGNVFELPQRFFDEIRTFDCRNIIEYYEDDFYVPSLSPLECETRERNLLLKKMGRGWLIQLDVDEYIYDFKATAQYLRKYWFLTLFPRFTPVAFRGKLITLFREFNNGYVYIENQERFSFITNLPRYTITRNNHLIRNHFTNISVIHQSWARSEAEIQFKIKNWGHRDDFDTQKYFDFWKNLSSENYSQFKNIHPINPVVWNELFFLKCDSIDDFIEKYSRSNQQELIPLNKKKMVSAFFKKILR